jgi:multidrug efflux pump subunit AcrA (membrane-fusion protein)
MKQMKVIKTGFEAGGKVEILSGLNQGDRVIIN